MHKNTNLLLYIKGWMMVVGMVIDEGFLALLSGDDDDDEEEECGNSCGDFEDDVMDDLLDDDSEGK